MEITPSPALLEALSTLGSITSEPRPATRAEAQAPAREAPPAEGAAPRSGPRGHLGRVLDISV
ncbi:MAG: hypothetical protein V3T29_08195 [Alphaproteobacteria bacterium]